MAEKFCVIAGATSRPETIEKGQLEKNSGQTIIDGDVIKVINKRGDVGVPNYTECWGVRLDKDGKVPETPINVKDVNYKGQIKEMPWGTQGGYLITCRYLRGYQSLDIQYQNTVLGAEQSIKFDDESSSDAFYLRLQSGDNFYDAEGDPYLIQMLRIHYLNRDSKFKSPDSENFLFWEKEEGQVETHQTKFIDSKFDALTIVNEAASDNTLSKIKNLYRILSGFAEDGVEDSNLFGYMKLLADTKPEGFLAAVGAYKRQTSDVFEKAKSYEVIDLTKDGFIAAGEGNKKELIAEGIPAKKEGMLDWLLSNYLDEKSFVAVFKLKQITDKLK